MERADIRTQWEAAAPGWSRWEATVATWRNRRHPRCVAPARQLGDASGRDPGYRPLLGADLTNAAAWVKARLHMKSPTTSSRAQSAWVLNIIGASPWEKARARTSV